MSFHILIALAMLQGVTEFLPISSSAHLVLLHQAKGVTADDIALDVAVHLGSILAVIAYFRADAARAARGLAGLVLRRGPAGDRALARHLVIATVPVVLAGGAIVALGWAEALRDIRVIGWTMIVFGGLLWWIDRIAPQVHAAEHWSPRRALIMGLWQAVALVPGVSRSGASITGARALGFERHDATRLSMLMSIPTTLATGAVLAVGLAESSASLTLLRDAAIAAVFAFATAWIALAAMMRLLDAVSFTPYVIYRIVLGVVLLVLAYGGGGSA